MYFLLFIPLSNILLILILFLLHLFFFYGFSVNSFFIFLRPFFFLTSFLSVKWSSGVAYFRTWNIHILPRSFFSSRRQFSCHFYASSILFYFPLALVKSMHDKYLVYECSWVFSLLLFFKKYFEDI